MRCKMSKLTLLGPPNGGLKELKKEVVTDFIFEPTQRLLKPLAQIARDQFDRFKSGSYCCLLVNDFHRPENVHFILVLS